MRANPRTGEIEAFYDANAMPAGTMTAGDSPAPQQHRRRVYTATRREKRDCRVYSLPEEPLRNACVPGMSVAQNIQRPVLPRALFEEVFLLIAANPVFGLDFAAVGEIHDRLLATRDRGAARHRPGHSRASRGPNRHARRLAAGPPAPARVALTALKW